MLRESNYNVYKIETKGGEVGASSTSCKLGTIVGSLCVEWQTRRLKVSIKLTIQNTLACVNHLQNLLDMERVDVEQLSSRSMLTFQQILVNITVLSSTRDIFGHPTNAAWNLRKKNNEREWWAQKHINISHSDTCLVRKTSQILSSSFLLSSVVCDADFYTTYHFILHFSSHSHFSLVLSTSLFFLFFATSSTRSSFNHNNIQAARENEETTELITFMPSFPLTTPHSSHNNKRRRTEQSHLIFLMLSRFRYHFYCHPTLFRYR